MWGRLFTTDATLLYRRLTAITRSCHDDPRTLGERRSDALGAIAAGADRLACRCGNPDCSGAGVESRAGWAGIHVIADEHAVQAARDELAARAEQAARTQDSGRPRRGRGAQTCTRWQVRSRIAGRPRPAAE